VTPAADTLAAGDTVRLAAQPKDASGNPLVNRTVSWTTSDPGFATVSTTGLVTGTAAGSVTIRATSEGQSATAALTVRAHVALVAIAPETTAIVVRHVQQFAATPKDSAGNVLAGLHITWGSSSPAAATVDSTGLATAQMADSVQITAMVGKRSGTALLSITPSGLPIRGLVVQIERRGWPTEYWNGQTLQRWDSLDPVVGTTVAAEVGLQLDAMHSFGVNTIRYELRAADSVAINDGFTPPTCSIPPVLGMRWPQPAALELQNLVALFDLVQSKGMRVILELVNTHMEEAPPTNSSMWLGAILGAVKNHPALELVLFDGNTKLVTGTDGRVLVNVCNQPAEAPLYLGPTSVGARYVRWAIGFGRSLGYPARQLSAEAIVGDYKSYSQVAIGGDGTDFHLWDPVAVLKGIFDALQIPDGERTYGLSFYEHRKCSTLAGYNLPCVDVDPDQWADSTLARTFAVIGPGSRARVIAGEMGYLPPVDPSWSTVQAFESLVTRMRRRGMDGGAFWRWVSFTTSEDSDVSQPDPVKRRGVAFVYNPVKDAVAQMYQSP